MHFRRLLMFFKINFFEIPSEFQTVWIQIRPDILLGLIWVQTVCKHYQQTTLQLMSHDIFFITGAFGYFECTHDVTKYTKLKPFEYVGKKTPLAVRFSTVGK